jgi:hypothetical protein
MPKKIKDEGVVVVPEPEVFVTRNEAVVEPTIPFKAWFIAKMNLDDRLKAHHAEAIKAYMKNLGLGDHEPAWKYNAGLSQYFGG